MAVYKRNYAAYAGSLTSRWPRFLILTRYSFTRLSQSKLLILFMALCLCYPLGCIAFVYLSHNAAFLAMISFQGGEFLRIDGRFFYAFCVVQGTLAYLLTAFVGPNLVSPDMVNGGMQLYLCRPFSRAEYVAGKSSVLILLLSLITWIPGLLIFAIKGTLVGWDFVGTTAWLAGGMFWGLLVWILVLSFLTLAISAWVRWKIAAGALLLGVFFIGAGFGAAINSVLRTSYGSLIDLSQVIHTIWADLLRYDNGTDMPTGDAWIVLGITCAICLWLLARRVRAFEVIK
jgi:ABC-2 type transport system permease protein